MKAVRNKKYPKAQNGLTLEQRKKKREMNLAMAGELNKQIAEVDKRLKNSTKTRQWDAPDGTRQVRLGQSITKTKDVHPFTPGGKNDPYAGHPAKYSLGEIKDMLTAERDYALGRSANGRRRRPVPIFKEGDTGGIATEIKSKRFNPLASPKSGTIRKQTPRIKP